MNPKHLISPFAFIVLLLSHHSHKYSKRMKSVLFKHTLYPPINALLVEKCRRHATRKATDEWTDNRCLLTSQPAFIYSAPWQCRHTLLASLLDPSTEQCCETIGLAIFTYHDNPLLTEIPKFGQFQLPNFGQIVSYYTKCKLPRLHHFGMSNTHTYIHWLNKDNNVLNDKLTHPIPVLQSKSF